MRSSARRLPAALLALTAITVPLCLSGPASGTPAALDGTRHAATTPNLTRDYVTAHVNGPTAGHPARRATNAQTNDTDTTTGTEPTGTEPTRVTVSRPTATTVRVNTPVTVTGTITGNRRDITIDYRTKTGWTTLAHDTTRPNGQYTTPLPTDWYGTHTYRIATPGTDTHRPGKSRTLRITVHPDYQPTGPKTAWKPLVRGIRWNPCKPITYRTNLAAAPPGALADVKEAFRRVHAATGITFRYGGPTRLIPWSNRFWYGKEKRVITVAWTGPHRIPRLRGNVIGLGGSLSTTIGRHSQYYKGGVAIDSTARLTPGFGNESRGTLLLHEIGHAIGLGHISAPTQVMYPHLHNTQAGRFDAGDLTGLRALGLNAGCLN